MLSEVVAVKKSGHETEALRDQVDQGVSGSAWCQSRPLDLLLRPGP